MKMDVKEENNSTDGNERSKSPRRVDRHRDKSRDRPKPYSNNRFPGGATKPPYNRLFLSNIPFEEKWQAIKDLLREKVGEVTYVELFTDHSGRSRGYGVVEFPSKELAEKCLETMNKYMINKRQLIVKPDYFGDLVKRALLRDGPPHNSPRYSNIFNEGGFGGMPMPNMPPPMVFPSPPMPTMPRNLPDPSMSGNGNFIQGMLGSSGPIGNTVFVANLDYKATYSKLKEVFGLAGNISKVDLRLDNNNKSRGMATVTFDTNMEALQAISMFNNQKLYDRVMVVRMDKENAKKEDQLPSGLHSIGPTLPLRNLNDGSGSGLSGYSSNGSSGFNSSLSSSLGLGGSSSALSGVDLSGLGSRVGRMGESLSSNSLGLSSGRLGGGLDLSRYGSITGRGDMNLEDDHARLLAAARSSLGLSEKERLDMDIARVDDRIRDINRSLAAADSYGASSNNNRAIDTSFVHGGMVKKDDNANNVVFVRNLPFSVSWQDLRSEFSQVGRVMFAQIKTDNGKSKGYGTVRFETAEQALLAVKFFDGKVFQGRKIDVKLNETNHYN